MRRRALLLGAGRTPPFPWVAKRRTISPWPCLSGNSNSALSTSTPRTHGAARVASCSSPARPASAPVHEFVRAENHLPDCLQRIVQQVSIHRLAILPQILSGTRVEVGIPARWYNASTIPLHHCYRAAGEIAERVRKVGVVPLLEPLPRKIAVGVERHLANQEIPERIGPYSSIASSRSRRTPADLLKRSPASSTKP